MEWNTSAGETAALSVVAANLQTEEAFWETSLTPNISRAVHARKATTISFVEVKAFKSSSVFEGVKTVNDCEKWASKTKNERMKVPRMVEVKNSRKPFPVEISLWVKV